MLLVMLTLLLLTSCKTSSKLVTPTVKLYGMPEVIKVTKGTEIKTVDGILVVPEDTNLWSQGAYEKQLTKANQFR